MTAAILMMFARYPRPGYVKTRLCHPEFSHDPLSVEHACHLYEAFLDDLIPRFQNQAAFDFVVMLGGANPVQQQIFQQKYGLHALQLESMPTHLENLGAMMEQSFERYALKGYRQMLLIGSDVPHLSLRRIQEAFRSFEKTAMVIGPDHGGGMYLVGNSKPTGIMREGIVWSQGTDRTAVFERCQSQGISVTLLTEEIDIDTTQDLLCWYEHLQASSSPKDHAPHTFPQVARWVASHHSRL